MSRNNNNNARNFQLTLNEASMEHYEDVRDYLYDRGCNYLISCIEENSRENLHMHIYVQFRQCVRLSVIRCYGAHIEVCRGSEEDNVAYVSKMKLEFGIDNIIDEYGEMRIGAGRNQHSLALDLQQVPFSEVKISEYKVWSELQGIESLTVDKIYKPQVRCYYIWGESGSGKSKKVYDLIMQKEDRRCDRVKYCNGFWIGVNYLQMPKIAWYDEFRDSSMPASEFINFVDYYVNIMNVKFRSGVRNYYEEIYITSVQSPHEIYKNWKGEDREQWIRRTTIIHMETF